MWLLLAAVSAVSAGLVSVTVKAGMKNVDSNLGTFLRTLVVLIFTFVMVLIVGSLNSISNIKPLEWVFIVASGLCTGFSWLCYFKALQTGDINKVVPVDKLSTVLTMILAITILGEQYWWLTFAAMAVMVVGTMLMIDKKKDLLKARETGIDEAADIAAAQTEGTSRRNWFKSNLWLVLAILSLVFASFAGILAKLGMESIDSNLGTFLRTVIVALMAFFIVLGRKTLPAVKKMTRKNWIFLVVSGVLTGISWLCYYGAMQTGDVSVIVPIDKLSILVSITFSYFLFKEKLSIKAFIGLILLTGGTLLLLIKP